MKEDNEWKTRPADLFLAETLYCTGAGLVSR